MLRLLQVNEVGHIPYGKKRAFILTRLLAFIWIMLGDMTDLRTASKCPENNRHSARWVLIYQFRNSVFHLQIETRNKTVLIYQFGNSMFHLQTGTRNEMFLSYTRVNVLFLPCKKAGPLIVNRNTKTRNSRYKRNVPLWNIGTANET